MTRIYLSDEGADRESVIADIEAQAAQGVELILRDDDIQSFYYTDDSFLEILSKPFIGFPLGAKLTLKDILPGVPITYGQHATLIVVAMKRTGFKALDYIDTTATNLHLMLPPPGGTN